MKQAKEELTIEIEIAENAPTLDELPDYTRENLARATNNFMRELFSHPNMVRMIREETARRKAAAQG